MVVIARRTFFGPKVLHVMTFFFRRVSIPRPSRLAAPHPGRAGHRGRGYAGLRVGRHDRRGVDAGTHGHVRCRLRVFGREPGRGVRDRGAGVLAECFVVGYMGCTGGTWDLPVMAFEVRCHCASWFCGPISERHQAFRPLKSRCRI